MNEPLFIVCVCVICAVALALVVWIIVSLVRQNKTKGAIGKIVVVDDQAYELVPIGKEATGAVYVPAAAQPQPAPEQAEAAAVPQNDELAMAAPIDDADVEGMVMLRRNETVPYPEAYRRLSLRQKGFVDEILDYAETKEGVKKVVNDKSASVYLGKKLVVRIMLKRGAVVARLTVQNNDFIAYTDSAGLNIKEKPVDVKIEEPEMVSAVKDIIDITYRDLSAERSRREEEKKALRREQRRLARERAKAAAEAAAADEAGADEEPAAESAAAEPVAEETPAFADESAAEETAAADADEAADFGELDPDEDDGVNAEIFDEENAENENKE